MNVNVPSAFPTSSGNVSPTVHTDPVGEVIEVHKLPTRFSSYCFSSKIIRCSADQSCSSRLTKVKNFSIQHDDKLVCFYTEFILSCVPGIFRIFEAPPQQLGIKGGKMSTTSNEEVGPLRINFSSCWLTLNLKLKISLFDSVYPPTAHYNVDMFPFSTPQGN